MSRFIRSFGFAFNGLKHCLLKEQNFRIHIFSSIAVIIAGFCFNISTVEWMIIILCIAAVLSMEMFNSSIEKLCDVVHKEIHPGIKFTKDIAAGAVLLTAIAVAVIGAMIFIPKIILLIKSLN